MTQWATATGTPKNPRHAQKKIKKRRVEQQTQFARAVSPAAALLPPLPSPPCSMPERHSCCGAELPPRLQIVATSPSKVPPAHWHRESEARDREREHWGPEGWAAGLGRGNISLVRDTRPCPIYNTPPYIHTAFPVQAPGSRHLAPLVPARRRRPMVRPVDSRLVALEVTIRHTRALGPKIGHPPPSEFSERQVGGSSSLPSRCPSPSQLPAYLGPRPTTNNPGIQQAGLFHLAE